MTGESSTQAAGIINLSLQSFSNLLKEFPKQTVEDFIYDDSTLKKIENARLTFSELRSLADQSGELGDKTLNESLDILSILMEELPRDAADEFVYDRQIHQMVLDARGTIEKLHQLYLEPE